MTGGLGIIIVRENDQQITYVKKCEVCGKTQAGFTSCNKPKGGIMRSSFICFHCKHHQDIEIYCLL